jgi:predicted transcriptional regulator of viral defense system
MQTISQAVTAWLRDRSSAVISGHDLVCRIEDFYTSKEYGGEPIKVRKKSPESRDINRIIQQLTTNRVIADDPEVPAFRVLMSPDQNAEDILCLVDPFLYVSHLSAMQRHGLTTRNPVDLSASRPAPSLWKQLAREQEQGRDAAAGTVPRRVRPAFPGTVRKRPLRIHETRHPGASLQVRNSPVRVASIGQTFADTLTRPQWCGGMSHVLEVWEAHAETFVEEILEAVDAAPNKLVKVRAGYILDERLGLSDRRIEAWTAFAQRGGSRVLDPAASYAPEYSEKWMISINARATQSS